MMVIKIKIRAMKTLDDCSRADRPLPLKLSMDSIVANHMIGKGSGLQLAEFSGPGTTQSALMLMARCSLKTDMQEIMKNN